MKRLLLGFIQHPFGSGSRVWCRRCQTQPVSSGFFLAVRQILRETFSFHCQNFQPNVNVLCVHARQIPFASVCRREAYPPRGREAAALKEKIRRNNNQPAAGMNQDFHTGVINITFSETYVASRSPLSESGSHKCVSLNSLQLHKRAQLALCLLFPARRKKKNHSV